MSTLTQLLIAEATEYEFKAELEIKKAKSWLKTVSAFANGVGGSIYFGVSDDGKTIGLAETQKCAEQISELIKTKIEPTIIFVLEPILIDKNKEILRLQVRNGQATPHYYSSDGNKVAYVRLGNESVQAPPHILNELILKGQHLSFDGLESRYGLNDYSFTLLEATYKQKTRQAMQKPNDFLSFGLILENEKLTHAGILFVDQCPLLQSRIFCTRWNGLEKGSIFGDALDDREYSGNIISLLENALSFVKNNSKVKWRKTPSGRQDMPDYPERAVFEAVVNAIIHRDYMIQGSEIHVDMYNDRLEIVSPGGMADGKRIQDLDINKVASVRRNPIISDMFHRLKLMECRGSGLRKIANEYDEENAPVFYSTEQVFIATLKNLNYQVIGDIEQNNVTNVVTENVTDKRIDKVLDRIKTNPNITTNELAEIFGVTKRTIIRDIGTLKKQNLIKRIGTEKNGHWEIIGGTHDE